MQKLRQAAEALAALPNLQLARTEGTVLQRSFGLGPMYGNWELLAGPFSEALQPLAPRLMNVTLWGLSPFHMMLAFITALGRLVGAHLHTLCLDNSWVGEQQWEPLLAAFPHLSVIGLAQSMSPGGGDEFSLPVQGLAGACQAAQRHMRVETDGWALARVRALEALADSDWVKVHQ